MQKLTRAVSIACITLALTACASGPYKHEVANLQASEAVHVVDARPKTESEQKVFSVLITSDAYAIYRNGSNVVDPSALRVFQHRVYEKLATAGAPVDLKIHHFVSYMNAQSSFRRSSLFALGGALGAVVGASTQNNDADFKFRSVDRNDFESITEDNEYTRAFYAEDENPNKAPVFVFYIDAEINGKRQFVRGVGPAVKKTEQNPYIEALNKTIDAFLTAY